MNEIKRAFIGKSLAGDRVSMFLSDSLDSDMACAFYLDSGEPDGRWNTKHFSNVTGEYLNYTYGKVDSVEHSKFIIEFCKLNGIASINNYSEESKYFKCNGSVVTFRGDTLLPPSYREVVISMPDIKRSSVSAVNRDTESYKDLNPYHRTLHSIDGRKVVTDVYRVLDAFDTGSAEIDHAVKKLLCGGLRGSKGKLQDYNEAIKSIEAAIELTEQKELLK